MTRGKELTEGEKGRLMAWHEVGKPYTWIASQLGRNESTIRMAVKRIKERSGSLQNAPRPGRPTQLTPYDHRHLARMATKDKESRRMPLAKLAANMPTPCSPKVVKKSLLQSGIKRCPETIKITLNEKQAAARLQWCQQYKNWTVEDWKKVIWSDEVSVSRYSDAGRGYVSRECHERFSSDCVRETGGGARISVMFWGCFYGNKKGPLLHHDRNVNAASYLDILESTLPEIMDLMDADGIFMHDNARPHVAGIVKDWFDTTGYRVISNWPAYSPDLNPIEHVWRRLKMMFAKRHKDLRYSTAGQAKIQAALKEVVPKLWDDIEEEFLESLIQGMPRRIQACIEAKGWYTKY